ncbi:MAG: hypothetical protein LBL34_06900 [Clostridiales bacterium]|jgi:hypothetical protein|nr:hypothetical protein [Clostridiales bacterium]
MTAAKIFSEVYAILQALGGSFTSKIPADVLERIEKERDMDYTVHINENKPIDRQGLSGDSMAMLAYIRLEYWLTDEQDKQGFLEFLKKNENEFNEKLANSGSLRAILARIKK